MKLLLLQACSAFSTALVNCAAENESVFPRTFVSHRLKAETDKDDTRRATLSLGAAFTVLMSSWPGLKDMGITVRCLGISLLGYCEEPFCCPTRTRGFCNDRLGALFEQRNLINS